MKLKLGKVVMLEHENQQASLVMERLLERMSYEVLSLMQTEFAPLVGKYEFEKNMIRGVKKDDVYE